MSYLRNDGLLLFSCLCEVISNDDPVRALNTTVDNLYIYPIGLSRKSGGASSSNLCMLLLFHALVMEIYRITREVNVVIRLKVELLCCVCLWDIEAQYTVLVVALHRRDKRFGRYGNLWRPLHRYSLVADHAACQTAILLL